MAFQIEGVLVPVPLMVDMMDAKVDGHYGQLVTDYRTVRSVYPYDAALTGLSGRVHVGFEVGGDGVTTNVHVITSTDDRFKAAATAMIEQWQVKPLLRDGEPVVTRFERTIEFKPGAWDSGLDASAQTLVQDIHSGSLSLTDLGALDQPLTRIAGQSFRIPMNAGLRGGEGARIAVQYFVLSDGTVRLPRIVRGPDGPLAWAAMTAIQTWKFAPLKSNGEPAIVRIVSEFDFSSLLGRDN